MNICEYLSMLSSLIFCGMHGLFSCFEVLSLSSSLEAHHLAIISPLLSPLLSPSSCSSSPLCGLCAAKALTTARRRSTCAVQCRARSKRHEQSGSRAGEAASRRRQVQKLHHGRSASERPQPPWNRKLQLHLLSTQIYLIMSHYIISHHISLHNLLSQTPLV